MKKITAFICIASLMTFCRGKSVESTQNGDFKLELLFEKDGCKMYRFKDGSQFIYWSDCSGQISKQDWHGTGKYGHYETVMQSVTTTKK